MVCNGKPTFIWRRNFAPGSRTFYNRRYILARLEQQFQQTSRYGDPFALLILDLDHFKRVNDTYGHQAGDEVLKHLVKTIASLIRATDLFGRYGGEEFLLVLHADLDDARATAERLREMVAKTPYVSGSTHIDLSMSIGLMAAPHPSASTEEMVRAADAALYRAKSEGRNRVMLADELYEAAPAHA